MTPHDGRDQDHARGDVLFLASGDVSTGRVEPISWMRTCEAYAAAGLCVTLATLRVRRPDAISSVGVWLHFGVSESFQIIKVPTPLDHDASVRKFRLCAAAAGSLLACRTALRAATHHAPTLVVHGRAPVLLAPFVPLRRTLPASRRPLLVFETHSLPTSANAWIVRAADLVVVNSEKLAADVVVAFGLPNERVLCAPLPPFNPVRPSPKGAARELLGLDGDAVVACYTGKMTREHNEFFLRTAAVMKGRIASFRMLLVGGNPEILEWTRRRAETLGAQGTVLLAGFVPPVDVGLYQSAADVLVYHLPELVGIFPYTTPAKGYEYQAMRRPIVATDFPLFGELFGEDGERAIRVMDRSPNGLADGIASALALEDGGRAMIERAAAFVADRTWGSRAATILSALGI